MSALLAVAPVVADSGTWSLGVKVGLPLACVGAFVLLLGIAWAVWWGFADDAAEGWVIGGFGFLFFAGLVGGCLFGYYPYGDEYHQYRDVSGVVTQVGNRFIASDTEGGGTSQRFVVTFEGSGQQFGIDDTRAALVKPGQVIHLRCIREHDSGSSDDGYACKWGSS